MKKTFIILLAAMMLLSVCSCKKAEEPDQPPIETEEVQTSEDTTESISGQFFVSDAEIYEIATPYASLYYPTAWKDVTLTEVSEDDSSYKVKFLAQLDGKSVPLYTVVFGESEGSYIISGTLTTGEDDTVRVYIADHSGEGIKAGLTGEAEATYLAMCEDVNVIVSNLVYTSGLELD